MTFGDDASTIDSMRVAESRRRASWCRWSIGSLIVHGEQRRTSVAQPRPTRAPRARSLVIGAAGWEGKFVVAALEERGWPRDRAFHRRAQRRRGARRVSSRSTPRASRRSWRSIRSSQALGGGDRSVRAIGRRADSRRIRRRSHVAVAARAGIGRAARSSAPCSPADTIGLGVDGILSRWRSQADAVALERRPAGIAIAARRVGAGRVVQIGYDDSWRWRMAGAPGSENAHREWWSRSVSAVAYAPRSCWARNRSWRSAGSPRLGRSTRAAARRAPPAESRGAIDPRLLLAAMMILLMSEWTSRRLRGLE